jgi:aryl-alcohol dehydrogenase (NADP+)
MEIRDLGATELGVSVFGLGTMTFGAESDEATSHSILDRYFEHGGRFVDTADVYSRGASEEIVGRWLVRRSNRDQIVLTTKARLPMGDGPEWSGAGRDYLPRALDASLRRLQTDHLDLYQMHTWDPEVPIDETLGVLGGFIADGKVRYIGVSNYTGWQIERTVAAARVLGVGPIASLQPQYNLLAREIELEILPAAIENGLGILPWSPLGGGWLTGKYSPVERPTGATRLGEDPGRGVEAYDRRNHDRTWRILEEVRKIATTRQATMSQVALNWVRDRYAVSSVLLGVRTVEQLADNLAALDWNLEPEEMDELTRASAPGIPDYIQGFLQKNTGMDVWRRLGTGRPT